MIQRLMAIGCLTAFLLVALLFWSPVWAQESTDNGWPREIDTPQGVVVIYQPQPEELEGNQLSGRVAVGVELKGSD